MSDSGEQSWSRELQDLFSYNPPAIEKADDQTPYRLPFTFFDRHIDSRLSLRRVVSVPSFTADIAEVIDRAVLVTKNEGGDLPDIDYEGEGESSALFSKSARNWGYLGNKLTDATSVARSYIEVSCLYCSPVGSTFALNPHCYTWLNVFRVNRAGTEPDEGRSSTTNNYFLEIRRDNNTGTMKIPRGIWNFLNEDDRMDLSEISTRFRRLVTYQFCAATDEYDELLEKMGDICGRESIPSFSDTVSGFPTQEMPLTLVADSTILPWGPRDTEERRSTKEKEKVESLGQMMNEPAKLVLSNEEPLHPKGITIRKSTTSIDDVTTFVKHAWTRSVMDDTTFIVFHCGKYERIGVRHRETGTLFLSDLIDVHSCRDPGYGKIQTGLYLLIIKDVMERARVLRKLIPEPSISEKKGQVEPDESRQVKKRPKTRSVTILVEKEKVLIFTECDVRDLALLQIRHMPLNSSSPSAFLRRGRGVAPGILCASNDKWKSKIEPRAEKYQAHEYFELLLMPDSDSGATGQVHKATLRMTLSDGGLLSSPVIVKVAFHDFQRKRLRHEYVVYKHLAQKGVKCIATIFGLFEDIDNESSALILSDAGTSLYDREMKRNPGKMSVEQVSVSREERAAFKQALSEIHKAGVRHYDIRPMNLMINVEGDVTIIDFDMAKMGAGKHSRKREFDDLCLLLQGSYCSPNQFRSSTTTQSSRADSDFVKDP